MRGRAHFGEGLAGRPVRSFGRRMAWPDRCDRFVEDHGLTIQAHNHSTHQSQCPPAHRQQTVPATGGSFDVGGSITEQEGTYTVCGYIAATRDGISVPLAASSAFVVTLAPQPCSSGAPRPLSLTAPTKLAYGRKGSIRVRDRIGNVDIESAVLTMQAAGSSHPFRTYAFTSGDITSIERGKTKTFSTRIARGSAPILIGLLYQEIATTTCTINLSVEITPEARAA